MAQGRLFFSSALPRYHGDEIQPYANYCIIWRETADPQSPDRYATTPDFDTVAEAYTSAKAIIAAAST